LETHIWVRILADYSTVAYYGLWLSRRLVYCPLRPKLLWRRWLCNSRWSEKRRQKWCCCEKSDHSRLLFMAARPDRPIARFRAARARQR